MVTKNARRRTEILFQQTKIKAKWDEPPTAEQILLRDNERIAEHQFLREEVSEADQSLVQRIIKMHDVEKIAAAFVRLSRTGDAAPSDNVVDFVDEPTSRRGNPERDNSKHTFQRGAWFMLSAGRKDGVEARWLLPMLCRMGKLNHGEVGKILINDDQTRIEISKDAERRFFQAISPDMLLEKGIKVSRANGNTEERRRPKFNESRSRRKNNGDKGAREKLDRAKQLANDGKVVEFSDYKAARSEKSNSRVKKKKLALKHKKSKSRGGSSVKKPRTTFEKRKRNSPKKTAD
jgi:ATP-dependent RNA helicase DeaD